jgi:hypothetical protein
MGDTIQFNGKHEFMAEKINNIFVNWFLPVKIKTSSLPSFQVVPKDNL